MKVFYITWQWNIYDLCDKNSSSEYEFYIYILFVIRVAWIDVVYTLIMWYGKRKMLRAESATSTVQL